MSAPRPREEDDGHHQQQAPRGHAWGRRRLQPLVGLALAGLSLYSLSRVADPQESLALASHAHRPALALSVVFLVVSLAAKSFRWRSLLPGAEPLGRSEAYRIFHVSMLLNNVLPLRLGDGVRVLSPSIRRKVTAGQALMVLVAERFVDIFVLGGLALVATPWIGRLLPLPSVGDVEDLADSAPGAALVVSGAALVVILAVLVVRVLPARFRPSALLGGGVARLLGVWTDIKVVARVDRGRAARLLAWTALAWVGTVWLHYLLLEAVSIPGSLPIAVAVTLSTNLSMAIPTTPAHIGIFHAAAAAPLLAAGTSSDHAVAYAVLVHAVNTVPAMLIGLVCLLATSNLLQRGRPPAA